ncbi:MAG: helix-turn-helix domain-containing protein, partial [Bacteroidota bacterium]
FSTQKPIRKYANKKIETTEAKQLTERLNELMTQEKIYTNPKLKLKTVAEKLAVSPHHLSQLLNDNLGKGFATYINEHRIEAACQLLGHSQHLSLEGVGYEVGFSSKSNFFITFKKIKGVTPAQFQRGTSKTDTTFSI